MSVIERISNPATLHATGMIAPLLRVATHLGYCLAIAGREYDDDDAWDSAHQDILDDFDEAILHLDDPPDMSPFVSQALISLFTDITADMSTVRNAELTKDEMYEALQIMNDNVAHVGARFEYYVSGNECTEGSRA